MNKSNRNITKDDLEAALNLKSIWMSKKEFLQLTQLKVSQELGTTQSTISQYLSGTIALNTDATLKFSTILQCKPEEIRPELINTNLIQEKTLPCINLEGIEQKKLVKTNYIGKNNTHIYAVLINTSDYAPRIRQNEYVIADSITNYSTNDEVLIQVNEPHNLIRKFIKKKNNEYSFRDIITDETSTIPLSNVISIHLIISIQRLIKNNLT
jgi:predicted transcriptional regulator